MPVIYMLLPHGLNIGKKTLLYAYQQTSKSTCKLRTCCCNTACTSVRKRSSMHTNRLQNQHVNYIHALATRHTFRQGSAPPCIPIDFEINMSIIYMHLQHVILFGKEALLLAHQQTSKSTCQLYTCTCNTSYFSARKRSSLHINRLQHQHVNYIHALATRHTSRQGSAPPCISTDFNINMSIIYIHLQHGLHFGKETLLEH